MKSLLLAAAVMCAAPAYAAIEGSKDPSSVVEQWSTVTTAAKIIDINFSETVWPATWAGKTGRDCPSYDEGGYVNAILDTEAAGAQGATVAYPVLFHNCSFATNASPSGTPGATAAFSRQYYIGEKPAGNSASTYNNWTVAGHTHYLEDNIRYDATGRPEYGEAGFVQMCRDAARDGVSQHGWMEIDHIPYVERVQWSWSSTSWGRGIKCDVKIGDGPWKPLVWMGSERQKQGWTVFSDQGYFMENVIDAHDVSLRWRVWDGEDFDNPVQTDETGACPFTQSIDPNAQRQAPRVHKIKIYGDEITAAQAEYARANPLADVGTLSDLGEFGYGKGEPSPDEGAPVAVYTVSHDGDADYTTIQAAIDAVPAGTRGIILIAPGVYEENVYAGRKGEPKKFISLVGRDPLTTVLTSSTSRGGNSSNTYLDCAALNVFTPCFYAEGITIRNTSGDVGQAEALYTAGDAHVFKNCVLSGWQDTYKANVGARGYFTECVVEGNTDFIYDGGLEWFENCEIRATGRGGYITAPAESGMPMARALYPQLSAERFYPGLFFSNCRLTAADASASFTLGRPWKETSGAMFMRCTLGSHIAAAGWTAWNGSEKTSSLYEYRNVTPAGTPADISRRASFSRQATDAEVEAYFNPEFLFSEFSKVRFDYNTVLNSAVAPMNFSVVDGRITWDGAPDDAAYIIMRDGVQVAVVTEPAYDMDAPGTYSVSSVSRYGVTSAPVEARESSRLLAFPTAEGFGKYTTGGRGGEVVTVTSLADDGSAGTLRWAFNQHKGRPITIVFAVSGDIALASELRVNRADWTLAGQTAPGDGIVITRNKVNFGGSQNFIVRNMRFRIGQKNMAGEIQAQNACGAENCSNFIFDHCSFGWSVEENMNTADCHFLTVQYSMVHEGLYNAGHSKGSRGYGCQWGGSPATYHHNLLAHNQSRSCRFNGARGEDYLVFIEYINNVNYNYGSRGACYGGENTAAIASYNGLNSAHECNFIGNYYRPGSASDASKVVFVNSSYAREGATSWAPAKWYVDGNKAHGLASATADNWTAMTAEHYTLAEIRADSRITPANAYYKYVAGGHVGEYRPELFMLRDIQTADEAFNTVVDKAGTVNRDKVETRVADDARRGTITYGGATKGRRSGIIDTEADAEGFFSYSTDYTVAADTDGDGMPDEWERAHGLDPLAADQNTLNTDGYTALEVYLASLMGEEMSGSFTHGIADAGVDSVSLRYDSATATITVAGADGGRLTVYDTTGALVEARRAEACNSVAHLPAGIYLVQFTTATGTPRLIKIAK